METVTVGAHRLDGRTCSISHESMLCSSSGDDPTHTYAQLHTETDLKRKVKVKEVDVYSAFVRFRLTSWREFARLTL